MAEIIWAENKGLFPCSAMRWWHCWSWSCYITTLISCSCYNAQGILLYFSLTYSNKTINISLFIMTIHEFKFPGASFPYNELSRAAPALPGKDLGSWCSRDQGQFKHFHHTSFNPYLFYKLNWSQKICNFIVSTKCLLKYKYSLS